MRYAIQNRFRSGISTFLLSFVFIFFIACQNESEKAGLILDDEEKSAFEDEETAENLFDVVETLTNSAIRQSEISTGGRISKLIDPELSCAKVTFSGDKQSGRIKIDFGDGCEGPDGKIRKGIIIVEIEGHWLAQGSVIYTVLKGFYIGNIKIEGTRILTNVSLDLEALVYTVEIIDGRITWPDETYLTRESDRIHSWKFGKGFDDFELQVEGEASGRTRLGIEYTSKTVEPLIFKSSCRENTIYLPSSGIKTINVPEKPVITLDYGMGECNSNIDISIGENKDKVIF